MSRIMILWMFFLWALLPALATAEEYFVGSPTAPLWEAPSFQAKQLGRLMQGDKVQAEEERNGWVSVRYGQQRGWMLKLMLSTSAPPAPTTADQQAMQTLEERARCRPSAFASTAAARGLMNTEEGFSQQHKLDFKAVEKMESWRATDQQALDFKAEGSKHEAKKK
ncbi:MAG: SH3 domain-containing protein [Desulfobacteraceae bacterium]|nr:SH3 domain-containing protein [Desulfobacteraceae bacterium]